jgi:hypothetical protein
VAAGGPGGRMQKFRLPFSKRDSTFRPLMPSWSRDRGTKGASHGEVAEWSIAPDSKSGGPKGPGGSNPSLSAILRPVGFGWHGHSLE